MKNRALLRTLVACAASALLLAACGGGGGGDGGNSAPPGPPPSARFGASQQFEGSFAGCLADTQKHFVRSYMDEVYLWYNEIPEVDPNAYSTIPDYFNALLVRTPDVNGQPKDRFSAVIPVSQARALLPSAAVPQDAGQLLMASQSYVPKVYTADTDGGHHFGYIQFNDHAIGAQDELINAFRTVQGQSAQDLVLDLRFNSGGFLYIALSTASMITGPGANGQVFERLRYNDKRAAETAQSAITFSGTLQFGETQYGTGTQLPQLGLPRVFVLTSGRTCSASESIINSLRGLDVQVIRIGSQTCGKPYGFREKDNCGLAFFPIEFQGTNAKGFGDYTTGFTPTCQVQDNSSMAAAGDPSDPLLTAAKFYIDSGACPANTFTGVQSAAAPIASNAQPSRPSWAGRLLLPQQH